MNICPVCNTRFKNTTKKCRYCNVMLEPAPPSSQTPAVAQPEKGKRSKVRVKQQTGYQKTWNRYKYPIIAVLVLLLGIVIAIIQKPEVKKAEEQTRGIESQKVYAPAVQLTASDVKSTASAPAPDLDTINDLFTQAFILCSTGKCTDPRKAIEYLSEAIKLKPDYAEAYNNRGNVYSETGQYQMAIDDYSESIRLRPESVHAYNNRGLAYSKLEKQKEAIEDYNEAIRLKPDNSVSYNNRGAAHLALGQYQQAIEDYSEAIRISPNYVDAYYNRANVHFDHGKKELGCPDAQKVCELGKCEQMEAAKSKGYCP